MSGNSKRKLQAVTKYEQVKTVIYTYTVGLIHAEVVVKKEKIYKNTEFKH